MLKETLNAITNLNTEYFAIAQKRLDSLTKPQGSLGRLEEFASKIVAIKEDPMPSPGRKIIFTFAGDHGVADTGVSAYPKEVTPQMVLNFLRGGAAINVLARHANAEVKVVDVGVDYDFGNAEGLISRKVVRGTENMLKGPAMTKADAIRCIEVGIALARGNRDCFLMGTGDMGIANTTPSSAITSVITGIPPQKATGRGTGISSKALRNKADVIKNAIELNRPDPNDPIDVLSKVGGAEIGAIAGLILGASAQRVPVVVDGFISSAGALLAYALEPKTKDYMFFAHLSSEKGHKAILKHIGARPVLDLDMRLGEGTGAAIAMTVIEAGLKIYREMATFTEAGVSEKS